MYRSQAENWNNGKIFEVMEGNKTYLPKRRNSKQGCCWRIFASFSRGFRDFCEETSMHGFSHICQRGRHPFERLAWLIITALAIYGAIDVSLDQWQRYNDNPTVVTLEKDYRNWLYAFPGITICSIDKINKIKALAAIKERWKVTEEDERFDIFWNFTEVVANSELADLGRYQQFLGVEDLDVDLYNLAVDIMPDLLMKPAWMDNLTPKWMPVMTEVGICYAVNSVALADIAINPNETELQAKEPIVCKYATHSCYAMMEIQQCTKAYIHSPYDVADTNIPSSQFCAGGQRKVQLSILESRSGQGVRDLAVRRRKCLYTDEPKRSGLKVYSMNMCRRSCRNEVALKLCGCSPFYNHYEKGRPCNIQGMVCLSKYSAELKSMTIKNLTKDGKLVHTMLVSCDCPAQCVDAVYQEIAKEDQYWTKGPFSKRGSTRFAVGAPKTRYSRVIVFHFQDLIVSFGGAAGLFLGASFLSFVEIFYFILEKSLRVCKMGCVKKKRAKS